MANLMNTQPNSSTPKQTNSSASQSQEIDLMALLGALIDRKYFIIALTALFMFVVLFMRF